MHQLAVDHDLEVEVLYTGSIYNIYIYIYIYQLSVVLVLTYFDRIGVADFWFPTSTSNS